MASKSDDKETQAVEVEAFTVENENGEVHDVADVNHFVVTGETITEGGGDPQTARKSAKD